MPDPSSFPAAALERLESLLHAPPHAGRALSLDALQGMLAAMALAPDAVPTEEWVAVALDEPATASVDPELVDLMERFAAHTAEAMADDRLEPRLYTLRSGRRDVATWCEGFLIGVDVSAWYELADADELDELLVPLRMLGNDFSEEERAAYTPGAWRRRLTESEAALPATLRRLRDYWAIVRTPPQTVRHAAPKAGRNDPCPCGSGRKFKRCCGA